MKGHVFLKVTGILMIIAAAFSIIVGVLLAGISAGCGLRTEVFLLGGAVFDVGRRHLPADCRNQGHQAQ